MIRLHSYHGTQNLGDAIQSLALLRLCKELRPDLDYGWVDRDNPSPEAANSPALVNGWLGDKWRPVPICDFVGVHCSNPQSEKWVSAYCDAYDVGSRDPATHERFLSEGVPSEMIGCATLTLPRYSGDRAGVWNVDNPDGDGNDRSLTHFIPEDMSWDNQHRMAYRHLKFFMIAQAVFTFRLHVLLPCIAFGTPVALTHIPPHEERRFSLAKYLGVEVGNEPKTYDASELAAKFRAFTLAALNRLSPLPS